MEVRIKICGLTRPQDARVAAEAGAFFGGVILAPDSPRTIQPDKMAEIFGDVDLRHCGVFVNEPLERAIELANLHRLDVVQLHGDETAEYAAVVGARTGAAVWKAVRPRTGDEFSRSIEIFAASVDGFLLDGWSAKARGGTGSRFPWDQVARQRERLDASVTLAVAGGLTPDNVAEVISLLAPDIVDVSSGVERAPGVKEPDSIRRFADAVRGAADKGGAQ